MKNWDDIRFFLAVARGGSVRAAAEKLNVNHSTVLRRIAQLENELGAHVFDKLPSGYRLTAAGEDILELAERMEVNSTRLKTRVFGRDQSLTGRLRVALPPSLAADLLMPDLAEFSARHPEIELELLTSYVPVNLTKRQADVAIRLVYDRSTLPPHLFGAELQEVRRAVYIAPDLLAETRARPDTAVKWLLKTEDGAPPDWAQPDGLKTEDRAIVFSELQTQLSAAKAAMGIAILPCFIGDPEQMLVRVPGGETHAYGILWLLTHGETRKTKRVRLFADYIRRRVAAYAPLLSGIREDLSL